MTDLSKLRTIDELDMQVERMERRADIQREKINVHVDFVLRQYNFVVGTIHHTVAPIRKAINEYRTTFRVASRIIRAFMPRKK